MENQCKERVDLLEALRQSRLEAGEEKLVKGEKLLKKVGNGGSTSSRTGLSSNSPFDRPSTSESSAFIGDGTIPAVNYPDLSRPGPPLPMRPMPPPRDSSLDTHPGGTDRGTRRPSFGDEPPSYQSTFQPPQQPIPPATPQSSTQPPPPPVLPVPPKLVSRTSSPEKRSRMLTTLRANKDGKKPTRSKDRRPSPAGTSSKAAGLAWDSVSRPSGAKLGQSIATVGGSSTTLSTVQRTSVDEPGSAKRDSTSEMEGPTFPRTKYTRPLSPNTYRQHPEVLGAKVYFGPFDDDGPSVDDHSSGSGLSQVDHQNTLAPPTPPVHMPQPREAGVTGPTKKKVPSRTTKPPAPSLAYRSEYPPSAPLSKAALSSRASEKAPSSPAPQSPSSSSHNRTPQPENSVPISRRPVATKKPAIKSKPVNRVSSESGDEHTSSSRERLPTPTPRKKKSKAVSTSADAPPSPSSSTSRPSTPEGDPLSPDWHQRLAYVKKHLPPGVDPHAAKQIFNEIVVQGDEVHWEDVAGLDTAKKALKEAVVYPFLRPDLFMGLREPARGMLLFGPPGTGKTMLARAVATESKSTFFAISASSLTSKWLGESEKLVRALFQLAKALAPSIIFVDEIDSLLSSRGGSSEHESTRRVKTEFLIQWSDLQRAAAGKEQSDKEKREGDASRVLVLAATNLPWAIDEAARRRFVRRQYIPLPEEEVRKEQLQRLMGHQKHGLNERDVTDLVELTEGELPTLKLVCYFEFLYFRSCDPLPPCAATFHSLQNFPTKLFHTLHSFLTPRNRESSNTLSQASPAPILPPSPRTPLWAHSARLARPCYKCPWMRSGLSRLTTSKLAL